MKKFVSFFVALALVVGFSACSDQDLLEEGVVDVVEVKAASECGVYTINPVSNQDPGIKGSPLNFNGSNGWVNKINDFVKIEQRGNGNQTRFWVVFDEKITNGEFSVLVRFTQGGNDKKTENWANAVFTFHTIEMKEKGVFEYLLDGGYLVKDVGHANQVYQAVWFEYPCTCIVCKCGGTECYTEDGCEKKCKSSHCECKVCECVEIDCECKECKRCGGCTTCKPDCKCGCDALCKCGRLGGEKYGANAGVAPGFLNGTNWFPLITLDKEALANGYQMIEFIDSNNGNGAVKVGGKAYLYLEDGHLKVYIDGTFSKVTFGLHSTFDPKIQDANDDSEDTLNKTNANPHTLVGDKTSLKYEGQAYLYLELSGQSLYLDNHTPSWIVEKFGDN